MEARAQLERMLRIQDLSIAIREAQKVLDEAPGQIEEIESRFRERNAEYVAVKDRFDELETDQRSRSGELTTLEETRKKFQDDLMQVKNQREYAAMLKEIDSVKAHIAEHEEAILKDMEEIEKLKDQLGEREEHIQTERVAVERERAEVEARSTDARQTIERLSADRERVESELPHRLGPTIRRLEEKRQGVFLSKAENGTCQCCFVRIRPQVFQEIKLAAKVHTCSNCRRYLYHEASLRPGAPAETETGPSAGGVGADAV